MRTSSPACVPKVRPLHPAARYIRLPYLPLLPSPPPLKKKLNQETSTPTSLSSMRFQRLRAKKKKKKGSERPRRRWRSVCLRGAEGRLTSVWLRFTYLGFPNDSPGAKRCVSQTAKKSESREDKKRGGTLLWLSDSW